jgi:murein DD-endopeptidase MepM/ murein hydrolase activator NlpD
MHRPHYVIVSSDSLRVRRISVATVVFCAISGLIVFGAIVLWGLRTLGLVAPADPTIARIERAEAEISRLFERDASIRSGLKLVQFGDAERRLGTGGLAASAALFGGSATEQRAEQLSRRVDLVRSSFDVLGRLASERSGLFTHLPILKPIAGGYRLDDFGMRIHPISHRRRMHEGVDIRQPTGTPVHAPGDGIVVEAGWRAGYGKAIAIDHGYGYVSLLAHLSAIDVHAGDTLRRGDLIGRSGATGVTTGPHLHFEIMLNGVRQNPADYFLLTLPNDPCELVATSAPLD